MSCFVFSAVLLKRWWKGINVLLKKKCSVDLSQMKPINFPQTLRWSKSYVSVIVHICLRHSAKCTGFLLFYFFLQENGLILFQVVTMIPRVQRPFTCGLSHKLNSDKNSFFFSHLLELTSVEWGHLLLHFGELAVRSVCNLFFLCVY